MSRVYNFSAGPAVLPESVLQEAAAEMLDYRGTGMSVMEMSHRSKTYQAIIDQAEDGREAALGLLTAAAIGYTGQDTPAGCLLATSAISCSEAANDVKQELAAIRRSIEARLLDKVKESVRDGHLPRDTDSEALAGLTMAVIQGMSTLARDGAPRDKLLRMVDAAMLAWPDRTYATSRDSCEGQN